MARDLSLKVILDAVDRATKPLRAIEGQNKNTAAALKRSRDQLKQLNAAQKDVGSFRDLKRASTRTSTAIEEQQAKVRDLTRQIEAADGPTKQLTKQRDAAIKASRTLTQRYDAEQHKLEELRRRMGQVDGVSGTLSQQQRELERRIGATNREIREQQNRLGKLARKQRDSAQAAREYARMQSRATGMVTTGAGGLATGTAALYAGGRLLAPGISYGKQTSQLKAVLRLQKDSAELAALNQQSKDLGASTAFTATQVSAGQTFLARAGFTPEAIRASMRDMLNMAMAGDMDLARAADIGSNIAGAFKIDPQVEGNMRRVSDVLTATSTRANVNIEMLGETMKYLGQAEGLDITLEQAASLAGLLGNIGVQGSQAGTTLRAMMNRLTSDTKSVKDAMAEMDLQVADSQGNLRPITDILRDIGAATEKMGNVQRAGILKSLFEAEAGSGMAELVERMQRGEVVQLIADLTNAQGEAQRAAEDMADNAWGDLQDLASAWENVGITLTQVNEGPLRDTIQNITSALRGVGAWVEKNPEWAAGLAKAAAAMATIVAVGGSITLTLGSILGPLAMARYGFGMFGLNGKNLAKALKWVGREIPLVASAFRALGMAIAANPIGAAITAIALAASLIYFYWEPISGWFKSLWTSIKSIFDASVEAVTSALSNWSPLQILSSTIGSALQTLLIDLPKQFLNLGTQIVNGIIEGIKSQAGALKDSVLNLGGNVSGWFKDKLGINSPSRVFMDFGRNTVDGYRQGLGEREPSALRDMTRLTQRLTAAGAGAAMLAGAGVATADSGPAITFDNRPPIAAANKSGDVNINFAGDIYISNGADESEFMARIRSEVDRALEERDRRASAARRSALYDVN